jgi:hypothetical protein
MSELPRNKRQFVSRPNSTCAERSDAFLLNSSYSPRSWRPPAHMQQFSSLHPNHLNTQNPSKNQLYPAALSVGPDGAFLSMDSNQWVPLSFSSGVQNPGKSFPRHMLAAFCRNDCQSPQSYAAVFISSHKPVEHSKPIKQSAISRAS